jgi:hypothetical protein
VKLVRRVVVIFVAIDMNRPPLSANIAVALDPS